MAAALFNHMTANKYGATSAGVRVTSKTGQSVNGAKIADYASGQHTITVMSEEGIDLSSATRAQLTADMVNVADHIVVMTEAGTAPSYLTAAASKSTAWTLPFLKDASLETHRQTRDKLKELITNLIQEKGL